MRNKGLMKLEKRAKCFEVRDEPVKYHARFMALGHAVLDQADNFSITPWYSVCVCIKRNSANSVTKDA